MFSKKPKKPEPQQDAPAKVGDVIEVKYPKPKILVLDLEDEVTEQLEKSGWNVTKGTFGRPYKVGKSSNYMPVIVKFSAPNYTEQEIVIVDLATGEPADGPEGEKHVPKEEPDWWAKCDSGIIDPRPRSMLHLKKSFDRILENGGVFVLFADDLARQELTFARSGYDGLYDHHNLDVDIYSFIEDLKNLGVVNDHGTEMFPTHQDPILGALVAEHIKDGRFFCVLHPRWGWTDNTFVLAKNKFDLAVGVAHYHKNGAAVIVLPQIARKSEFIFRLVQECLPAIAPHLFPHIQKGLWTHRPEYELPRVMQLKAEQVAAEQRARGEVAELEKKLQAERSANGWLHDLLTGTDTELVEAVKKALALLGFSKVVDVDEERDKEGKSRREDLQIQDQSPTLIVDVKGVGGFPSDDEALQAEKHAAIRMRELKRTDIVGLSIVNHQRHLPPLDRENNLPFRQELIDAALERTLGLMTAWDLYRIVRNFQKHGWRSEDVKPIFYRTGRIEAVPRHYMRLGTIAKVWTDKFGVIIEQGELQVGDRVAVEFPIEFEEVAVESIQVKDQKVEKAKVGEPAGILWPVGNLKLREGMRVFHIQKN
jgi:hypothetical protein